MDEVLKQILSELKDLKQGQKTLEEGQSLLLKMHFEQEDKMNSRFEKLDKKLDRIYNNTDGIAKNFIDTSQEVTVTAHQVREHEDRITALEEKIA